MAELERRSRATPGLQFIVLADERIRRQVKDLQVEDKAKFPSFAHALREVLQNYAHIWSECRLEVVNAPARPAPKPDSAGTTLKNDMRPQPKKTSNKNRSRTDKFKQMKAELEALKNRGGASSGNRRERSRSPRRPDNRQDGVKPNRIPSTEWERLCAVIPKPDVGRTCRFGNSSVGCQNSRCGWDHACILCGDSHKWVDKHYRKA